MELLDPLLGALEGILVKRRRAYTQLLSSVFAEGCKKGGAEREDLYICICASVVCECACACVCVCVCVCVCRQTCEW